MSEIISIPNFLPKTENGVLIVLDGYVIGCCKNPTEFQIHFNRKRLENAYHNVSLVNLYNEREIHIETDEGRFIRPLFTVDHKNDIGYKNLAETCKNEILSSVWSVQHPSVGQNLQQTKL